MSRYISEATRRDIIDAMIVEGVNWSGRLEEPDFLRRVFDLDLLPSTDGRFKSASGDIWQHRINNLDGDDDWVFTDSRFQLLDGDDEVFLRFLCQMLHPVVRPDPNEVERLRQLFNQHLANDSFEIIERARMSGRPVFAARRRSLSGSDGIPSLRRIRQAVDADYVLQQITRMEAAIEVDPGLAIGTSKELIETCCKTILRERDVEIPKRVDIPQLVKLTSRALQLTPEDVPEGAKAEDTIRRLLSNLATVSQGIAELRNCYGTGHGQHAESRGLQPRHAKLAVGAGATIAVFLMETHQARARSQKEQEHTS